MKNFLSAILILMTALGAAMHADDRLQTEKNIIILLGPPGSGKGTQAVLLSKELKIPHISTGDLFRENIKGNTPLGKKAKTFIDAGHLVPDDLVLDMLFARIEHSDTKNGFLLDGFPRTIPQAEAFDHRLEKANVRLIVFNLEVPDDVIVQRAAGRLTCSLCGHVHNKQFTPPKQQGKCDKCDGNLIQRSDDQPEVVLERLRVYHSQTKPLILFYHEKGLLTNFDGKKSPEKVFDDLLTSYKSEIQ